MDYQLGCLTTKFGLTKNAIRHYEKLGLVNPVRDPKNNYRRFDSTDIGVLCKLHSFRSSGFTLEEIGGIFQERSIGGVRDTLREKQALLSAQIEELQSKIHSIHYMLGTLDRLEAQTFSCRTESHPHLFWMPRALRDEQDGVREKAERMWIETMPFVRISHMLRFEDDGRITRADGYCTERSNIQRHHLPVNEWVRELVPRPSVRFTFSFAFGCRDEFQYEWFLPLFKYVRENGYTPAKSALSYGIWSLGNGPDTVYFNELWLPIENADV
ncbi:MAG TPA: MerR family transcriptional regulator [Terriglobales bacterium]|nr:MerR family transcriptional regulator [Terriglobales bacterium]